MASEPRFDITDKNDVGRPPKVTDEQKQEVLEAYRQYIKDEPDPTVADFVTSNELCWDYDILDHDLENWSEFKGLKKRAIQKQEAYLLKKAGKNEYNPTLAIFRLKQPQHGYRDRVDTDITSGGEAIAPVLVRFMGDNDTSTD